MKYELKNVMEPNLLRDTFSYDKVPAINLNSPNLNPEIPENFWITDTTFRDGQQARTPYTPKQIADIFTFMHRMGGKSGLIRQSEFFLYSKNDRDAVEKCQELGFDFPQITSWIRAVKKDFDLVKSMGIKETGILTSCSDYHIFLKLKKNRRQALDGYKEVVSAALENNVVPRCHFEDITRADIFGFVIPMINELLELCSESPLDLKVRLCDTMGYGLPYPCADIPRGIPSMIKAIKDNTDLKPEQLEWHGHNDFHKVLVNAVTGWLYGASAANGTLFGFGERTGNPPIEGLIFEWMGLTGKNEGFDTTAITDAAEYFKDELKCDFSSNYPFVGKDFNTTRAGIHADGLTKNEEIYNIFNTDKYLNRPVGVAVTNNSGLAGIAFWVHSHLPDKGGDIRKNHPGLIAIKKWIDEQYLDGRITSISDEEMFEQIEKHMSEIL